MPKTPLMRPSIPKRGCPCLKPDPKRVLQNQTYLPCERKTQPKGVHHQHADLGSPPWEERARSLSHWGHRGGTRRAEAVMESHPDAATSHNAPHYLPIPQVVEPGGRV